MKRLGSHPADVGSESADAVEEAGDPVADAVVDVERSKEAHKNALGFWLLAFS
jgi:hypothetical protein